MKVSDVMTSEIITCSPNERLSDCARMMKDLNIGITPVVDQDEKLVGVITDRDIAVRAVSRGEDLSKATVGQFMTPSPTTVDTNSNVEAAADLMAGAQVRRLPVTQNGKLVGIVSLGDLAVDIGEAELMGEILERISTPVR